MPNNTSKSRPEDLPDFRNPPLNEVLLGVQFSPPKNYQQILAGEVWNLFRADFPKTAEQPALVPTFETFGLPSTGAQLSFVRGAEHDRFWFLRPDGDELIQFQQDRLLHNWRKVGDESNPYPRFESMIERFSNELSQLQDYMAGLAPQKLSVNQCEISYINHIAPASEEELKASDWLRFLSFDPPEPEDFTTGFREVIRDQEGNPRGRLLCNVAVALKPSQQRIIHLTLTVRGAPEESDIDSAINFISSGREMIVRKFAQITTSEAHKKWGRV